MNLFYQKKKRKKKRKQRDITSNIDLFTLYILILPDKFLVAYRNITYCDFFIDRRKQNMILIFSDCLFFTYVIKYVFC